MVIICKGLSQPATPAEVASTADHGTVEDVTH